MESQRHHRTSPSPPRQFSVENHSPAAPPSHQTLSPATPPKSSPDHKNPSPPPGAKPPAAPPRKYPAERRPSAQLSNQTPPPQPQAKCPSTAVRPAVMPMPAWFHSLTRAPAAYLR